MKAVIYGSLGLGAISLIVAIISRLAMTPVPIGGGAVEAHGFLALADSCFLLGIALLLLEKAK